MISFHMLLEKRFPSEEVGTNITWKWLFASVSQNMSCEVALLIERFTTKLAWKWLFSSMNHHMAHEVTLYIKVFATIFARKWLISSMNNFDMFFNITIMNGRIITKVARKWFLASMDHHMVGEVALCIERFATFIAWKWPFSFMNVSYVSIEVALETKHFATLIATK